ncbi:DNA primase family protein [Microbacterium sp. P5_E9]
MSNITPLTPGSGKKKGKPQGRRSLAQFSDAEVADLVGNRLQGRALWSGGWGWLGRRTGVWEPRSDSWGFGLVSETMRAWAYELAEQMKQGSPVDPKEINRLLSTSRAASVTRLVCARLEVRPEEFDADPYLLNCPNGVLHLYTGEFREHRASDRFMKSTAANYDPDARSDAWDAALESMNPEVRAWMQLRFGHGLTGYKTPDDKVLCLIGGGSNGKSVMLTGIENAGGDYVRQVSPKVITSTPSEHTTSMTTLLNLRIALLEELPEGRHLNVARVKSITGTETITARRIAKDDITFHATHAMFITSNYLPTIDENDHGTWRRLERVPFPFRYIEVPTEPNDRPLDLTVRARVAESGEAVLAWLVEGARLALNDPKAFRTVPAEVQQATAEWRAQTDVIQQFAEDCLTFGDDTFRVSKAMVVEAFSAWLRENGHSRWSSRKFWGRWESSVLSHAVTEGKMSGNDRRTALIGVRLITSMTDAPYVAFTDE